MSESVKTYLRELDGQLSYLSEAERRDIMEEVGSHIYERIQAGSSEKEILAGFGQPRELAKSYGGEAIANNTTFNLKSLVTMMKFYFVTGMKGVFIIPFVSITSITFYACSIIIVIAAVVKGLGGLSGFEVPITLINIGFWQAPDWLAISLSFLVAVLLYIASRKLWSYLKKFLREISHSYRKLS